MPPGIALVAAAIVEDSRIRWKGFFRFAFFLPYFFSMAVAGAIFTRVYDPSYGMSTSCFSLSALTLPRSGSGIGRWQSGRRSVSLSGTKPRFASLSSRQRSNSSTESFTPRRSSMGRTRSRCFGT